MCDKRVFFSYPPAFFSVTGLSQDAVLVCVVTMLVLKTKPAAVFTG